MGEEKHSPWWSIKGSLSTKLVEPHTKSCHQMAPVKLDSGITDNRPSNFDFQRVDTEL